MERCQECYSKHNRITPMFKPEECLKNHLQYVCSTCERCICVNADSKRGLHRYDFPFTTLEAAVNYLRAADVINGSNCSIYEIKNEKGRKFYKIFKTKNDYKAYCNKNSKKVISSKFVYIRDDYIDFNREQIKFLNEYEIERYLKEQSQ